MELSRFRSLRFKLLMLILGVSLLPLAGISFFAYFMARETIAADRIKLFLEQMAQDTVDKLDLTLLEKQESVRSMAATLSLELLNPSRHEELERVLNILVQTHEVYDLILILDAHGTISAVNTVDRFGGDIARNTRQNLLGHHMSEFPTDDRWLERSLRGHPAQSDWYPSDMVHSVYDLHNVDIAQHYNVGFSEPLVDPNTGNPMGAWICVVNWGYIQEILDTVEQDLRRLGFESGYAFLLKKDGNTTIGHKYRKNRLQPLGPGNLGSIDNYGATLLETHRLKAVHDAVVRGEATVAYNYPPEVKKISGLARVNNNAFGWVCGVGINDVDIFRPVQLLKLVFIVAPLSIAALVILLTLVVTRGITIPLGRLTETAQRMSRGDLSQRVTVTSKDEVGLLGGAFNEMAASLAQRDMELLELNKNLERKVRERTEELERSNQALQNAYLELQNAQEHLIQSEKMASLGQLVAGIAHEIKNPLNFIYGNTGFLEDYAARLKRLIGELERLPSLAPADRNAIDEFKRGINYQFMIEDLDILIQNFAEGARRINAIVSDLRTFSRMDAEQLSEIDLHASIDIALNLLTNQYRDRIRIHRQFGEIPPIQGFEGKLNQVFMNLLSNAIHAIEKQGDIWIRTYTRDSHVCVEVRDSGIGISKGNLKKIFEPFFTTKGVGQGTGLGLSISYGIIQQHEGSIEVESQPGQGSTFRVILPIRHAHAGQESSSPPRATS